MGMPLDTQGESMLITKLQNLDYTIVLKLKDWPYVFPYWHRVATLLVDSRALEGV